MEFMNNRTANDLMEDFTDTLQQCGTHLLKMCDEDIGYYIFEEFDICAGSFLHSNTLSVLLEEGLITENVAKKSAELRKKFFALENTELWNIDAVRTSEKWKDIMTISDDIKTLLGK